MYNAPEHHSCHGMSQWMHAFYAIILPCSVRQYKKGPDR